MFCPTCRTGYKRADADECEACVRHRRIGAVVFELTYAWTPDGADVWEPIRYVDEVAPGELMNFLRYLDALEGLAELLIDRGRLIRQHRKELFEEQREAQRAANYAYSEGKAEGRREEDW